MSATAPPRRAHWIALLPSLSPAAAELAAKDEALLQLQLPLAWWSLQFTPRVALLEEAVVLEVQGSLRLFGGLRALHRRLRDQGRALGLGALAWAPSSLAALALARAGLVDGLRPPLTPLLDSLPLHTLSAAQAQAPMLQRLGCRTLGQLRTLPRGPLARRFGDALLLALDQAYGLSPEAHSWVTLPERFAARRELAWRIEHAPALLQQAEPLLLQLSAWLTARHAGVLRFTLGWQHDAMRARDVGPGGALALGTAEPTRDINHLRRLLAEHLARQQLAAPVAELSLSADEVQPLAERSASLLPDALDAGQPGRESLQQLLERIAARLGPERVRRVRLRPDHRPEQMQRWLPWGQVVLVPGEGLGFPPPQPSWLLEPPLRLATRQDRPLLPPRGTPLQLLAGPQRLEGGWWGRPDEPDSPPAAPDHVQRDYYLAHEAQAGLLWIYHERLAGQAAAAPASWFLHGVFA